MPNRTLFFPAVRHVVMLAAIFHLGLSALMANQGHGQTKPIRIVALGDSLTAGYGLPPEAAFPVQLERALKAKGHNVEILNAGVSGDTTAAALERFDWAVPEDVHGAIVELGANDALRGLDPTAAKRNLAAILAKFRSRGVPVLLAGMMSPRNWGDEYVRRFDGMYRDLATEYGADLYPFFLDGVAMKPGLTLPDGLHPTADGIAEVVRRILPAVEALVAKAGASRARP